MLYLKPCLRSLLNEFLNEFKKIRLYSKNILSGQSVEISVLVASNVNLIFIFTPRYYKNVAKAQFKEIFESGTPSKINYTSR